MPDVRCVYGFRPRVATNIIRLFEIAPAPPTNFSHSHWPLRCISDACGCECARALSLWLVHATQWHGKWYWKSQSIRKLNWIVWCGSLGWRPLRDTMHRENQLSERDVDDDSSSNSGSHNLISPTVIFRSLIFRFFMRSVHTLDSGVVVRRLLFSLQRYVATHYTHQPVTEWIRRRSVVANQHHRA